MKPTTPQRERLFDELLSDFLEESGGLLARLDANLAQLDQRIRAAGKSVSPPAIKRLINDMFRSAHSIKGLAELLGLAHVHSLTHKIESVFDAARKNQLRMDERVVSTVLRACDRLNAMVEHLREHRTDDIDYDDTLSEIAALLMQDGDDPFADLKDDQAPAKYVAIFVDETDASVDALTDALLACESAGEEASIKALLVLAHRIKGSAASIGLRRPAKLAHLMEDTLQELRDSGRGLTQEIVDALLHCTDGLRSYVQELRGGKPKGARFTALAQELQLARNAALAKTNGPNANAAVPHALPADSLPSPQVLATAVPPSASAGCAADASPITLAAEATINPSSSNTLLDHATQTAIWSKAPLADRVVAIVVEFVPDLALAGLKARLIYEKAAQLGPVHWCDPALAALDALEHLATFRLAVAGELTAEALEPQLRVAGVARLRFIPLERPGFASAVAATPTVAAKDAEPVAAQQLAAETLPPDAAGAAAEPIPPRTFEKSTSTKAQPPVTVGKPAETLRVDIERLDQLMNLAGQLVINKARFARFGETLRTAMLKKGTAQLVQNACASLAACSGDERPVDASDHRSLKEELDALRGHVRRVHADLQIVHRELLQMAQVNASMQDLSDAVHELDRVAESIQKSVMDTRMVPIGPLFSRFRRVLRDITRGSDKQVELVIHGEKTELDKRMIDELGDPLIHLVRNAADHGIESPDVRIAQGKSPQGAVTLDAFHRGNSIVIRVSDDGRGIDPELVRRKAVSRGLVSAADAERLSRQQILNFIWEPGFSTAEKVTEISGRGMGMDIVRAKVEDLSGTVDLDSTPGVGTTFTIKLPLTLAILPSLMARIGPDVFAIPIESVVEIVRVGGDDIKTVHGRITARVRERVISVVHLHELLKWHIPPRPNVDQDHTTLVILGIEGSELGLVVDDLLGEQDIVIKSLAENYRNVYGLSGASILGDGRVSLILDPVALLDTASRRRSQAMAGS